jgi:16S rRNA (cytosine967-C5)-methyltransferase
MKNSREIALTVLNGVTGEEAYSNILLNKCINESNLNEKDRGLVTEIVYGTLKYKYTIDKILAYFIKKDFKKLDLSVINMLRLSIYQIKYLTKIPEFAAVNEAVEIIKKSNGVGASKFVNGVLRNYLRNKDVNFVKDDEMEKICFDYSFEPWMAKLFLDQYGREKAIDIMSGSNEVPAISFRTNGMKANAEEVLEKLKEAGFTAEKGYIYPQAITIVKGKNIEDNKLFNEGYITVQDESAMLVASSMELHENMKVFDMCSAPGGKTTHISELMNNTGEVKAFDIHKNKLKLIEASAKRLGLSNISLNELDSSKFKEDYKEKADRVLIDVPCSGLGIIKKKPEIKWSKSKKDLKNLIKIQREIMEAACQYAQVGGILMYSTCTLNKEENEENIKWFLSKHEEFKVESLCFGEKDNILYNDNGSVTILPNKHMDGFFICKLKKAW